MRKLIRHLERYAVDFMSIGNYARGYALSSDSGQDAALSHI